jgi:hypothetical protein
MSLTYIYDLDGTLSEEVTFLNGNSTCQEWQNAYAKCLPIKRNIKKLQELYDGGNTIIIHTARFPHDRGVTERWLKYHNVPFHSLILGKPKGDFYVDVLSRRPEEL